jgi:hypothetical protein
MSTLDKPTVEFLEELLERAKRYGWSGDYIEVQYFVESLYEDAEIDTSSLDFSPYEDDE